MHDFRYPTLAYFRNGKKAEDYRGARTLKELTDFVKSMTEDKADKAAETADKVRTMHLIFHTSGLYLHSLLGLPTRPEKRTKTKSNPSHSMYEIL